MATLAPQERLQPALLDRLVDEDPEKTQEVRDARLITSKRLRQAVLRDLEWLFNAVAATEQRLDAQLYPYAARSVINFGLPPLSGTTASTLDSGDLEKRIRQAIMDYEPRIIASTLKVRALIEGRGMNQHNQIQIEIRGNLWAEPIPIELLLRTAVDLETGETQVQDAGS